MLDHSHFAPRSASVTAAAREAGHSGADHRRAHRLTPPPNRSNIELSPARDEFARFLRHPGHRLRFLAQVLCDLHEQNFGPHIEQKCADLVASFGSVSSWKSRAVSGSSPRLN